MNDKIKTIQLNEDGFVNIIRQFGGHGMRSDMSIIFIDNIINIKEAFECTTAMAKDDYLAIKIDDKNLPLIEYIIKSYTRIHGGA